MICIEFVYLYFLVLFCLSVLVKWLAVRTASEMTYIVSSGALNSTPTIQNAPFRSQIFCASCGKGALTPLTKIPRKFLQQGSAGGPESVRDSDSRVLSQRPCHHTAWLTDCTGRATMPGSTAEVSSSPVSHSSPLIHAASTIYHRPCRRSSQPAPLL